MTESKQTMNWRYTIVSEDPTPDELIAQRKQVEENITYSLYPVGLKPTKNKEHDET